MSFFSYNSFGFLRVGTVHKATTNQTLTCQFHRLSHHSFVIANLMNNNLVTCLAEGGGCIEIENAVMYNKTQSSIQLENEIMNFKFSN